MPRPRIKKVICKLPKFNRFVAAPKRDNVEIVELSIEEFETFRLLDNEGLSQVECALQMNVSRPTVQLLYSSARKKISELIVNGKTLEVNGGDYVLCDDNNCKNNGCCGRNRRGMGENGNHNGYRRKMNEKI